MNTTFTEYRPSKLYQRIHLWATTQGLAMQPINYTSQRADREENQGIEPVFGDALQELINDPVWDALMSFRVGYPTVKVLSSPRRSVEKVTTEQE